LWSKKYCDSTNQSLTEVVGSFLDFINFHMIPASVLMKDIHPLGLVPYHIIMNALAYQADPNSVDQIKRPSIVSKEFGNDLKNPPGKATSTSGDPTLLDPYGSNLTLSSSTSSAVGLTQDNSLIGVSNLLNISSQQSSRSSSMSRYSN